MSPRAARMLGPVLLVLASGVLSAGCGQKGPLYLPEEYEEEREEEQAREEQDGQAAHSGGASAVPPSTSKALAWTTSSTATAGSTPRG